MVTAEKRGQTVVCVDDEPLTREAIRRTLRREPYDLHLEETPRGALEFIREHEVSLVIADQRMPEMTGVELLAEVRKVSPSTQGLILTAYPESVLSEATSRLPLLAKPWDDETLRRTIQEFLQPGAAEIRPFTVLAPLDGRPESELVLDAIMPLAGIASLRIEFLRVLPRLGLYRDVSAYLERLHRRMKAYGIESGYDVRWGIPADQILYHARHTKADLIVLATHGRKGFPRLFEGSVTERVLRRTDAPILSCRSGQVLNPWKRILVPLDGTPEGEAVLPEALRWARKSGATLDLARSTTPDYLAGGFGAAAKAKDPSPYLEALKQRLSSEEVPIETAALRGAASREIVDRARETNADLICMSTRGRSGLLRWILGSAAETVIRTAPCPVYARRIPR